MTTKLAVTNQRARKPHICQCGGVIRCGERYERELWIVDGDITVVKVGDHIHTFEVEEQRLTEGIPW